MIQGMYMAANGMIAVEDRQAVIANNIANASTHGFKRQLAVQKGFYGAFMGSKIPPTNIAPGGGVNLTETFSNFSGGALIKTGGALDIALQGDGFFKVQQGDFNLFTRNGQFSVNSAGFLSTPDGNIVLDTGDNPIDVSGGIIAIDQTGGIKVNGEVRAQLAIIKFDDPHALKRLGDNIFQASEDALENAAQAIDPLVVSHSLETSNVEVPTEMINMMMALRAYGANQKVITSIDETLSRMIDQVGGPS